MSFQHWASVLLLFIAGLTVCTKGVAQEKTSGGRFQLIQLSNMRRDQFLLDTQTGRIWVKTCFVGATTPTSDCEMGAWALEQIEGINITKDKLYKDARELRKFIEEQSKAKGTPSQ